MLNLIDIAHWKDDVVSAALRIFLGTKKCKIFYAVQKGRRDIVKKFLESEPGLISAKNGSGKTLLHLAAFHKDYFNSKLLLEANADVNAIDDFGETPLHKAAWSGSLKTVELLIAHGAKINIRDQKGGTPLHEATWQHKEDVVAFLLLHGADVNAKDCQRKTPLDYAIENARRIIAEKLLAHGAIYLGDPMKALERKELEMKLKMSAPLFNPKEGI